MISRDLVAIHVVSTGQGIGGAYRQVQSSSGV